LRTVIVVPVSRERRATPFRPAFRLGGERAVALLDQVRTIESARLMRRVGKLGAPALRNVLATLRLAFAD
jgi:mRNA interferase MazF